MSAQAQLPTGTTQTQEAPQAVAACPKCQTPLIDPDGLGWCKSCGYCRSLESEKGNQLLAAERGPSKGAIMASAAGNVPLWVWVLFLGVGVLAVASVGVGRWLPEEIGKTRALWTSVQIIVGLVLIFAGQLVALILIAPEDERLSFKDAIMPTRLWPMVVKRLPRFHACLWTSVWGLSLIVFALIFVGGLSHWMTYLPGGKNAVTKVTRS